MAEQATNFKIEFLDGNIFAMPGARIVLTGSRKIKIYMEPGHPFTQSIYFNFNPRI